LLRGATLVVPNREQRHDFDLLDRLMVHERISHAFIPPALLAELPDYHWPDLRHLVTGGDVCEQVAIARWARGRSLYNLYGPTETTVAATAHRLSQQSRRNDIGRPIANTQILLLNERGDP